MKPYCTQNDGDCSTCSLVNYGRDCMNQPIDTKTETPWSLLAVLIIALMVAAALGIFGCTTTPESGYKIPEPLDPVTDQPIEPKL